MDGIIAIVRVLNAPNPPPNLPVLRYADGPFDNSQDHEGNGLQCDQAPGKTSRILGVGGAAEFMGISGRC